MIHANGMDHIKDKMLYFEVGQWYWGRAPRDGKSDTRHDPILPPKAVANSHVGVTPVAGVRGRDEALPYHSTQCQVFGPVTKFDAKWESKLKTLVPVHYQTLKG